MQKKNVFIWLPKKIFIALDSFIAIFFLSIFVAGCVKTRDFSCEQKDKLAGFFEELLLEHGGAYTLFGSKPVTIENLLDYTASDKEQLDAYFEQHPDIEYIQMERQLEEGWEVWKKTDMVPSNPFVLTEIDFPNCRLLVFANVHNIALAMERYRREFERVLGESFVIQEVILELKNGDYDRWKQLLTDSVTEGILLGYGGSNARIFRENAGSEAPVSENNDPRLKAECYLNGKSFRIPIFVMFDQDEGEDLRAKYKRERKQIKKHYARGDFLDVTLAQLNCGKRG